MIADSYSIDHRAGGAKREVGPPWAIVERPPNQPPTEAGAERAVTMFEVASVRHGAAIAATWGDR